MRKKQLFATDFDLSLEECAKVCRKSRNTVIRWEREGWPEAYADICRLYASGRVMPYKWTHTRFNRLGNLEMHNGEIAENEVLNIPYMREITRKLTRELNSKNAKILELQKQINALDNSASNDHFFIR